jgi:hypothetical protein
MCINVAGSANNSSSITNCSRESTIDSSSNSSSDSSSADGSSDNSSDNSNVSSDDGGNSSAAALSKTKSENFERDSYFFGKYWETR